MTNFVLLETASPMLGVPVLIADPAVGFDSPITEEILRRGHPVALANDPASAIRWTAGVRFGYALVEMRFDGGWGFDLVETLSNGFPSCRIVAHSAYCDIPSAVLAVQKGADDVVPKPLGARLVAAILFDDDIGKLSVAGVIPPPNEVKERHIISVVADSDFKIAKAARTLSMDRRGLQRFLNRRSLIRPAI